MNRPEYDQVVNMLLGMKRIRTIKHKTGVQPRTIRQLARAHAPRWVKWSEEMIAKEYQEIGCKATMREWSISGAALNAVLERQGVPRKSSSWTGEYVRANKDQDVAHPVMTKAISMKWCAA